MNGLTLLDIADRVSHNVSCVLEAASHTVPFQVNDPDAVHRGPFTTALLSNKPLTTFLRDAYPGESRLLQVAVDDATTSGTAANLMDAVTGPISASVDGRVTSPVGVAEGILPDVASLTRRQIVSATPLRRKNEVGPAGEHGDVFFKSALKLIERYQGQPRTKEHVEHLLARYEELQASTAALRKTIEGLNAQIPTHQAQRTDEYQSVKQAEQSVREIEGRVAEARRKRDALRLRLHNLKYPGNSASLDSSVASSSDTTFSPSALMGGGRQSNQLLTSETIPSGLNFGQGLYSSTMTPARAPARAVDAKEDAFWTSGASSVQADETTEYQDQEGENSLEDALEEGEGDETVILSLHHPRQVDTSPPSAHVLSLAPEPSSREESSVPTEEEEHEEEPDELSTVVEVVQEASMIDGPMSFSPKLEEISVKLWNTVGDIVLPNNTYGKGGEPLPGAEETIKLLRTQSVAPGTPANTSLTSKMLLVLLTSPAGDSSGFPAPVTQTDLKKAIDELAEERGFGKNLGLKTIFGCVAKKLVRIDRRAREATIAFEV